MYEVIEEIDQEVQEVEDFSKVESDRIIHAKRELERAGYDKYDDVYKNVLNLVKLFDNQNNNPKYLSKVASMFKSICYWNILSPIKSYEETPDDWEEGVYHGEAVMVSKRLPNVFLTESGHYFDGEYYVFRNQKGVTFFGESEVSTSRCEINIPYMPRVNMIDVREKEDGTWEPLDKKHWNKVVKN